MQSAEQHVSPLISATGSSAIPVRVVAAAAANGGGTVQQQLVQVPYASGEPPSGHVLQQPDVTSVPLNTVPLVAFAEQPFYAQHQLTTSLLSPLQQPGGGAARIASVHSAQQQAPAPQVSGQAGMAELVYGSWGETYRPWPSAATQAAGAEPVAAQHLVAAWPDSAASRVHAGMQAALGSAHADVQTLSVDVQELQQQNE